MLAASDEEAILADALQLVPVAGQEHQRAAGCSVRRFPWMRADDRRAGPQAAADVRQIQARWRRIRGLFLERRRLAAGPDPQGHAACRHLVRVLRRRSDAEPAGVGQCRSRNDAEVRQIRGDQEPVEPGEGVQRLIDERVALAAHLHRHAAERLPEMVGDEQRARRLRALIVHRSPV